MSRDTPELSPTTRHCPARGVMSHDIVHEVSRDVLPSIAHLARSFARRARLSNCCVSPLRIAILVRGRIHGWSQ